MPPTNESPHQAKKRKKDRACDACRRRKTKCDGPWMAHNVCTNCSQTRKSCTYVEGSKPRGPPKAYVTGLEDKLEALEALLQQIRPGIDFSEELGPPVIRDSWKSQNGPTTASSSSSATRKSSLTPTALSPILIPFQSEHHNPKISTPLVSPSSRTTHLSFRLRPHSKRLRIDSDAALSSHPDGYCESDEYSASGSSSSSSDTEEIVGTSLDGRTRITLLASENDDTVGDHSIRFHGRSSTAGLVEATRIFKHMHMRETMPKEATSPSSLDNETVAQTRRPRFWQRPPWELPFLGPRLDSPDVLPTHLEYFPPPDLADSLIDLYFQNSNLLFPLLHRPTFNRQWREQLHHRNMWFACVCISMFAVASRWSNDKRVLPEGSERQHGGLDWRRAGRLYFEISIEMHIARRCLFHPASLFEVQSFTLMAMYLRGTSAFPAAWTIVSVGIRKAQDVGAHRKRVYHAEPSIDNELWKRAFWHLVVFDRICGATLGRACGVMEEDFDIGLPLEVDDDYWEANNGREPFTQPPGVPSSVSAFNQLIKLTQIVAFATRTLYAVNKTKVFHGLIPMDRESLLNQLTPAMDEWLHGIPVHLQWKDEMDNPMFAHQSATLIKAYHLTQILIHRTLIGPNQQPLQEGPEYQPDLAPPISPVSDPAIDFCTKAAGACARVVEIELRQGITKFYVPTLIEVSYACAGLLLLYAWNLKVQQRDLRKRGVPDIKPPLAQRIETSIADANIFLRTLEELKPRWDIVDPLLEELQESLPGLDSQESSHDTPDLPSDSYSKPVRHGHWPSMRADYEMDAHLPVQQYSSICPAPHHDASPRMHIYPSTSHRPMTRHPSFPDVKPGPVILLPETQTMPTRVSDTVENLNASPAQSQPVSHSHPASHHHSLPNGRLRAISAASAPVSVSYDEHTLPYISSSMRRTSFPNITLRGGHGPGEEALHHPRTSSSAPNVQAYGLYEDATRCDDINMHFNDGAHSSNLHHLQQESHLSSSKYGTHMPSRTDHYKRNFQMDSWGASPLPPEWTGPATLAAASYTHGTRYSSTHINQHDYVAVQEPLNPAYTF